MEKTAGKRIGYIENTGKNRFKNVFSFLKNKKKHKPPLLLTFSYSPFSYTIFKRLYHVTFVRDYNKKNHDTQIERSPDQVIF